MKKTQNIKSKLEPQQPSSNWKNFLEQSTASQKKNALNSNNTPRSSSKFISIDC